MLNVTIIEFIREPYADIQLRFQVECLGSALFWAVPILTKYGAHFDFKQPVHENYSEIPELPFACPSFWPAAKNPPLDMPIPFDSDAGTKSIKDEAIESWTKVQETLQKSSKWMANWGVHKCVWEGMKIGMAMIQSEIEINIRDSTLIQLLQCLTHGHLFPETRLLGFELTRQLIDQFPSEDTTIKQLEAVISSCPFWLLEARGNFRIQP